MHPLTHRFNQIYANLPIPERKMPIYVDPWYGAMSWFVVKLEVDADTEIENKALDSLNRLGIITEVKHNTNI